MRTKESVHWVSFVVYMNEENIFDSFPGIGSVIASDVVRPESHLHSRDIAHRDIKQCPVPITKVTNTNNWRWRLAKKYCL